MFRIVTARRLRHLEASLLAARAVSERLTAENHGLQRSLTVATAEWRTWEKRASRFIDQVGLKDATISTPVMTEPGAPPQNATRQVMSALGRQSLSGRPADAVPQQPAPMLGVNEDAARDAVASIFVK